MESSFLYMVFVLINCEEKEKGRKKENKKRRKEIERE